MRKLFTAFTIVTAFAATHSPTADAAEVSSNILRLGGEKYDISKLQQITPRKSYSISGSNGQVVFSYWIEASGQVNRCNNRSFRVMWIWDGYFKARPAASRFKYRLTPLERKVFNTIDFSKKFKDPVSAYNMLLKQTAVYELSHARVIDLDKFLKTNGIRTGREQLRVIAMEEGRIAARLEAESRGKYNILDVEYNAPAHDYVVEVHLSGVPLSERGISCALQTAAEIADILYSARMR